MGIEPIIYPRITPQSPDITGPQQDRVPINPLCSALISTLFRHFQTSIPESGHESLLE
jgi:hypothetical protein